MRGSTETIMLVFYVIIPLFNTAALSCRQRINAPRKKIFWLLTQPAIYRFLNCLVRRKLLPIQNFLHEFENMVIGTRSDEYKRCRRHCRRRSCMIATWVVWSRTLSSGYTGSPSALSVLAWSRPVRLPYLRIYKGNSELVKVSVGWGSA